MKKATDEEKSHITTYQNFEGCFSLRQISEMDGSRYEQIANHLVKCINLEYNVDINREVSRSKQKTILEITDKSKGKSLKTIKETLPDSFTYEEINLIFAKKLP